MKLEFEYFNEDGELKKVKKNAVSLVRYDPFNFTYCNGNKSWSIGKEKINHYQLIEDEEVKKIDSNELSLIYEVLYKYYATINLYSNDDHEVEKAKSVKKIVDKLRIYLKEV